ncbi:hypothetical protein PPERSA_11379 [Pseudocohnilembus persalinus]|uniref:Uncharacterized protein n=1 Tax=Pseudocohnilembus persalinus TaxID=266149 RepID=A0A0V0QPH2_PSEPJ|nr:hypothetical protein PPERSA_11379 [Pseudocohnilembus persalinus]|eukprot:KRX04255.1 hypothetical protein PPERSA_11379 [Pseudocohnilembus persalinus]
MLPTTWPNKLLIFIYYLNIKIVSIQEIQIIQYLQNIIKKNPQLKYLGIYSSQLQGDAPYQELQKILNLHKFGSNGQLIFVDHWLNKQKIDDEDNEEGQIKTYFTNNKSIISDQLRYIEFICSQNKIPQKQQQYHIFILLSKNIL